MKKYHFLKRSDHEVYFIEINKKPFFITERKLKDTLTKELSLLHPVSLDDYIFDICDINIETRKWAMIHLIRKELFAELKILGLSRYLFTNTVSFFSVPRLAKEDSISFKNETIGINKNGVPYSDPIVEDGQIQENLLPTKKGKLFHKKYKQFRLLIFSVIFIATVMVFLIAFLFNNSSKKDQISTTTYLDSVSKINTLEIFSPDLFIVADQLSSAVFELNGIINSLLINDDNSSFVVLDVSNCKPQKLLNKLLTLEYFSSFELSEIRYYKDSPHYTVRLIKKKSLLSPSFVLEAPQNYLSSETGEGMRLALIEAGAEIKSERSILTTKGNSVDLLFKIQHLDFSRCVIALSQRASKLSVFPEFIHITPDRALNQYTINYRYYVTNETSNISYLDSLNVNFNESFGFKKNIAVSTKKLEKPRITLSEEYEKIGSINQVDGVVIHYCRNKEGKILEITH